MKHLSKLIELDMKFCGSNKNERRPNARLPVSCMPCPTFVVHLELAFSSYHSKGRTECTLRRACDAAPLSRLFRWAVSLPSSDRRTRTTLNISPPSAGSITIFESFGLFISSCTLISTPLARLWDPPRPPRIETSTYCRTDEHNKPKPLVSLFTSGSWFSK